MQKITKEYYDYHELCREVETRFGVSLDDYDGLYKQRAQPGYKYPAVVWAEKHGYDASVLEGDIDHNSPEMEERKRINGLYYEAEDGYNAEPTVKRFWSYALEHIFYDVNNGCERYFDPWEAKENVEVDNFLIDDKGWVLEVLDLFIKLFEENDIDEGIEVYISW